MDRHSRKQMREHFADLTNNEILGKLRNQRALQMLEEALGDDILPGITRLEERDLDLGKKLTKEDVVRDFPNVKQSVDTFLDVDCPTPDVWVQTFSDRNYMRYIAQRAILGGGTVGYLGIALGALDLTPSLEALVAGEVIGIGFGILDTLFDSGSFYDTRRKSISLAKRNVARARGVMAHEYVHRVQAAVGMPFERKFKYLLEGMAEAVQYIVGRDSKSNDDSVRYEDLRSRFNHMQNAYGLLAKRLGIKVKKELTRRGQSFHKMYAYGTAFCYLQEVEHGPGFYRELTSRAREQLAIVTNKG